MGTPDWACPYPPDIVIKLLIVAARLISSRVATELSCSLPWFWTQKSCQNKNRHSITNPPFGVVFNIFPTLGNIPRKVRTCFILLQVWKNFIPTSILGSDHCTTHAISPWAYPPTHFHLSLISFLKTLIFWYHKPSLDKVELMNLGKSACINQAAKNLKGLLLVNVCIHDFDDAKRRIKQGSLCFKINTRLFQQTKPWFKISSRSSLASKWKDFKSSKAHVIDYQYM